MHNIPNLITLVRLISALCIIVLSSFSLGNSTFLPLFIAAGISDMLDGFIARKFNWCTEFGATLDSVSDMTLYAAVFFCFQICLPHEMLANAGLLAFGVVAQLFHWAYSVRKHGGFPAYHSNFSRLCAYAMFFSAIGFWQTHNIFILSAIIIAWISCTVEGIAITTALKRPKSNVPSIFEAIRISSAASTAL